ncbi:tyrosine-type recombinase/integrase [Actinopolymorpha cephalotaxi]|uniref:tyrosine-type recombinase/integrase n=1 Tax=Actinopolymorpha cephalotaxi TaxID=504797 RepID=UPI00158762E7
MRRTSESWSAPGRRLRGRLLGRGSSAGRSRGRDGCAAGAQCAGLVDLDWKRSVGWRRAAASVGAPTLRVHDLRHTAASIWLAQGADPKVVQRVLGHTTASMTMDLYGHLLDVDLWTAAGKVGGISGAFPATSGGDEEAPGQ